MSRAFIAFVVAFALVALAAASVSSARGHSAPPLLALDGSMTLRRVVFAHRHGARTPIKNINGTCDAFGCGTLTVQGQGMLESLGNYFLGRYAPPLLGVNRATGKANFDLRSFKATSDDQPRCIQSAGAFWRGLFGSNSGNTSLGAAHLQVLTTDSGLLIDPYTQPAYALHFDGMTADIILNLTSIIEQTVIDVKTIVEVGKELGLNALECEIAPVACVAMEFDFLAAMNAAGRLNEFPVGAAHLAQLDAAALLFYKYSYGVWDEYVKSNDFYATVGWPASTLFQAMLADAADDGVKIAEFSGHDTTLMPLYAAMGNLSFIYPDFAAALVFEVYAVNSGASASVHSKDDLFVRALLGVPTQTPGTGWPYTFEAFALTCLNSTSKVPYVTSDGCPLADLQLYAASRLPPQGTCAAWPHDLKATLCTPTDNSILSTDPKTLCGKYRAACPLQACGDSAHLLPSLACAPN